MSFTKKVEEKLDLFLENFSPLYDKLFYFPGDRTDFLGKDANFSNIEKFFFKNSLGDSIHIWKLQAVNPKGRVIHCHGSGFNVSSHYPHVSWLPRFGYEVIMFDYPGYGESSGKPTRHSTVRTAYDVIKEFAVNKTGDLPQFVLGQSLGGNIAAVALTESPRIGAVCGVILDSMYSSFRRLGAAKIHRKYLKRNPLLSQLLALGISEIDSPLKRASQLDLPTLIIHSRNDHLVSFSESIEFYKKIGSTDVELWSHLNSGHTEVLQNNISSFQEALVGWMDKKAFGAANHDSQVSR